MKRRKLMAESLLIGVLAELAIGAETTGQSYSFAKDAWTLEDWTFMQEPGEPTSYSWQQEDAYVANRLTDDGKRFHQTGMLLKKKFSGSVRIKTRLAFEEGCATIKFVSAVKTGEGGRPQLERELSICFHKGGVGVWHADYRQERPWKRLAEMSLPLATDTPHQVEIYKRDQPPSRRVDYGTQLEISVDGHKFTVAGEPIDKEWQVGINTSEGRGRFYDFSCEQ